MILTYLCDISYDIMFYDIKHKHNILLIGPIKLYQVTINYDINYDVMFCDVRNSDVIYGNIYDIIYDIICDVVKHMTLWNQIRILLLNLLFSMISYIISHGL